MKLPEKAMLDRIRSRLQDRFSRLFRNNVGVAFHEGPHGKRSVVRYGLCPGSSDLIGWTTIEVTPAMIGTRVAVFTALELKRGPDTTSAEQANFMNAAANAGGIAGIISDDDSAEFLVDEIVERIKAGGIEARSAEHATH